MSLAQGLSAAFKWAQNTVLRKIRMAVCSAFSAFACTHTPPSFRSHHKQPGLGASFIHTGRKGLERLPGHIPVCCRMSSMGLWHFTRLHAHTTHPSKTHICTYIGVLRPLPTTVKPLMWPVGYLSKRERNLSMGCEDTKPLNQILYNESVGWVYFPFFQDLFYILYDAGKENVPHWLRLKEGPKAAYDACLWFILQHFVQVYKLTWWAISH